MLPGAVRKRHFNLAVLLKTEAVMIVFFLTITYFLQSIIQQRTPETLLLISPAMYVYINQLLL